MYLVLFEIKNEDFKPENFGLTTNMFSIDITKSISDNKNIQTTSQPVLDGTTRLENISREPGNFSLSGTIADHHFYYGDNQKLFVKPTKIYFTNPVQGQLQLFKTKSRLVIQKELLEYLRDNAIFLDIYTNNGEIIYNDYIIKSLSFSQDRFGAITVNIGLEQVLMFDMPSTIDETGNIVGTGEQENLSFQNIFANIIFNPNSFLPETVYDACAGLIMGLPRNARFIAGANESNGRTGIDQTFSVLNVDYSAYGFRSNQKVNKEVLKSHEMWSKDKDNFKQIEIVRDKFRDVITSDSDSSRKYVEQKMQVRINNKQAGNTPLLDSEEPIALDRNKNITTYYGLSNWTTNNALTMLKKSFGNPEFEISKTGYSVLVIENQNKFYQAQAKGWSFLRETETISDKTKEAFLAQTYGSNRSKWPVVYDVYPNLINDKYGYLFNATFGTHGFRLVGEAFGGNYKLYHTLIYIIPEYWQVIKQILQSVSDSQTSPFHLGRRIYSE